MPALSTDIPRLARETRGRRRFPPPLPARPSRSRDLGDAPSDRFNLAPSCSRSVQASQGTLMTYKAPVRDLTFALGAAADFDRLSAAFPGADQETVAAVLDGAGQF